jgi:hypothetical protein
LGRVQPRDDRSGRSRNDRLFHAQFRGKLALRQAVRVSQSDELLFDTHRLEFGLGPRPRTLDRLSCADRGQRVLLVSGMLTGLSSAF